MLSPEGGAVVVLRTTYHIHVYTIGLVPGMLDALFQPLLETGRYLMESFELSHFLHLLVIPGGARIKALDYGTDIAKYTCIHKGCKTKHYSKRNGHKLKNPSVSKDIVNITFFQCETK